MVELPAEPFVLASVCAIGLAVLHVFAHRLGVLNTLPRSRWLSFAGGASVAYVFVHVFPELSEGGRTIQRAELLVVTFSERHVYLVALAGFTFFYGVERLAQQPSARPNRENPRQPSTGVFWIHVGSFAFYNVLIGYLLFHQQEPGVDSVVLFTLAMGFHFVVTDYGLREAHRDVYDRMGRWLLAIALLTGALVGYSTEIDEAALAVLFAFLAGGIVLNVVKEELPEESDSRFWAFAAGGAIYTAVLLLAGL